MTSFSAILIASGESRRMGGGNKLLLELGGEALVRRCARMLLAAELCEIVIVTGHEADLVTPQLAGLPLRIVRNGAYRNGQMSSVHTGFLALSVPSAGVIVALADQPLLGVEDLHALMAAFAERSRGSFLVPTWHGARGNPVIVDWAQRQAILAGGANLGCRKLIERHPEQAVSWEAANDHVVVDLDSPEDYARLRARIATLCPAA